MKLLLDENLPKRIKHKLLSHEAYHVSDMGWQGKKNGALLAAMLADGFEVLITMDKSLKNQQNFAKYPIPVLVLTAKDNTFFYFTRIHTSDSEITVRSKTANWSDRNFNLTPLPTKRSPLDSIQL